MKTETELAKLQIAVDVANCAMILHRFDKRGNHNV